MLPHRYLPVVVLVLWSRGPRSEKVVLDNRCAEIRRDPREIKRSCGTQKFATDVGRDALVKAGATHRITG